MDTFTRDLIQNSPRCIALDRAIAARDAIARDLPTADAAEALVKAADAFLDFLTGDGANLYYDDETLFKVREALLTIVDDEDRITEAISAMQNAGILFRERR